MISNKFRMRPGDLRGRSGAMPLLRSAILLLSVMICGQALHAVPLETSHWNSNTFGNLNTVADKTDITFRISYNQIGTIEWYKDRVLVQTNENIASAEYTTSWSSTGMKQIKAKMKNSDGTSIETVWRIEVWDIGTAKIEKAVNYPQSRLGGSYTINVTTGWVNFPTLYLKIKDPETWIEYIEQGTYIVKTNLDIRTNATLIADDGSARVLKLRSLPKRNDQAGEIRAFDGGTIRLDNLTILGWDLDHGTEVTNETTSPIIRSSGQSTLRVSNSECHHVVFIYESDTSTGDLLDHNNFIEANPYILNLTDSKYQTVTNNRFYHGWECNLGSYNSGYGYNRIENNQFIGGPTCGDNFMVGQGSTIIGNEFTYAGWNLAEIHYDMFCRDNVLHDNGGHHNGFNGMMKNVYSYNDYAYNFKGFSGFYCQVKDDLKTYPSPMDWYPDHVYIINGRAKNASAGFNFFGGYNCYVYNFSCELSCGNVQYGSDNIFVRKSRFAGTQTGQESSFRVVDVLSERYGYVHNISVMDSVFSGTTGADFGFYPASNAVLNIINCYRTGTDGEPDEPSSYFYPSYVLEGGHPEMKQYVWLDVLVKDQNGQPVKDANVTVECLTDPAVQALKVTLPPPPPDLRTLPSEYLPQPALEDFTGLTTLSTGKLPGPNYGWSANPEPCVALLFKNRSGTKTAGVVDIKTTTGYQYNITANYQGLSASLTVTPDTDWYREDPESPAKTVQLVLGGESSLITNPVVHATANTDNLGSVMTVYPNPYIKGKSRGSSCIFANLPADATVRVYTINGDLITTLGTEKTGEKARAEWDVSQVGGGIYFYTVSGGGTVVKGKVGIVK